MGGKAKQSQRTKNNVRPSSSGRSAELLGSASVVGAGKPFPALFPTLATDTDAALSPEFMLCIKKLNKKDPITKTKALQELTELVKNGTVEEAAAVLPLWPRYYNTLTMDADHKVREAVQVCHGVLVGRCGRRVGPRLRALLAAWLQAQHDPYAPAAAQAARSLTSTFPGCKLGEAIAFCKVEVMAQLRDQLLAEPPAPLAKSGGAEEQELAAAAAARAAAGALAGLRGAAEGVAGAGGAAGAAGAWLAEQLAALLDEPRFWTYASHPDDTVKAAWFSLMCTMVPGAGGGAVGAAGAAGAVPAARLRQLARAALGAARGRSSAVQPAVFSCIILLLHHCADIDVWGDKKKELVQRILDVIANGGWGSARHTAALLLPLLAHAAPLAPAADLPQGLVAAVLTGLDKTAVIVSKSERAAWLGGLADCVRYLAAPPAPPALAAAALRDWLQHLLAAPYDPAVRAHLLRTSARAMTELLKTWLRLADHQADHRDHYDQLVRSFWQNIGSTLQKQIEELPAEPRVIEDTIAAHTLLLQELKTAFVQEPKQKLGIRFDGDAPAAPPSPAAAAPAAAAPLARSAVDRFQHNLSAAAHGACAAYLQRAERGAGGAGGEGEGARLLPHLLPLLGAFDSAELFGALAAALADGTARGLYRAKLAAWLRGDAMRCAALVDLLFMMMRHLGDDDKDMIFDSFDQLPPEVVEWCLLRALAHPHCGWAGARRWAGGAGGGGGARAAALRLAAGPRAQHIVAHLATPEPLFPAETVEAVAQLLAERVRAGGDEVAQAARLASQLLSSLGGPPALADCLLRLTATKPTSDDGLGWAARREAEEAWLDALAGAGAGPGAEQAARAHSATLLDALDHEPESFDAAHVEHLAGLCARLLGAVGAGAGLSSALPAPAACGARAAQSALRLCAVTDTLNCPFADDNEHIKLVAQSAGLAAPPELTLRDAAAFCRALLYRLAALRCLLQEGPPPGEGEGQGAPPGEGQLLGPLLRALHDAAVLKALHEGYAFWQHYDVLHSAHERVQYLLREAAGAGAAAGAGGAPGGGVGARLAGELRRRARSEGYFWACAERLFEDVCASPSAPSADDVTTTNADDVTEEEEEGETITPAAPPFADDTTPTTEVAPPGTEVVTQVSDVTELANDLTVVANEVLAPPTSSDDKQSMNNVTAPTLADVTTLGDDDVTGKGFFHSLQMSPTPEGALSPRCLVMLRCVALVGGDVRAGAGAGAGAGGDVALNAVEAVLTAYYKKEDIMLMETDIVAAPWPLVVANTAVLGCLAELAESRGWQASPAHWDFTCIALCGLLASAARSRPATCTKVCMVGRAALRLLLAVQGFVARVPGEAARRAAPAPAHVAALPREWADVFAPALARDALALAAHLAANPSRSLSAASAALLEPLLEALARLAPPAPPPAAAALGALSAALEAPAHHAYKYLAHAMLRALLPQLVRDDAACVAAWSAEGAGGGEGEGGGGGGQRVRLALAQFEAPLLRLHELADAALNDVRLGEEVCSAAPHSDTHGLVLALLLAHEALLEAAGGAAAGGDLQHHYIQYYTASGLPAALCRLALRLLPALDGAALAASAPLYSAPWTAPRLALAPRAAHVAALAARCFYLALTGPMLVGARGWWGCSARAPRAAAERVTRACVAPAAARRQLRALHAARAELPDVELLIHWSSWEVEAAQQVDERRVGLALRLAPAHPLAAVGAACSGVAPLPPPLLQHYLAYQGGSVLGAVRQWAAALARRVAAAPVCYICYSRLHAARSSLPRAACHTCRNKFHAECLHKWFATSNKSSCPICRAAF